MSIIDIRAHVGTQPTDDRAYTTANLLAAMDAAGIDHALCTHWGAIRYDAREGNRRAWLACENESRLAPIAVINPAAYVGIRDAVIEAKALGCVGYHLMPSVHGWSIGGVAADRALTYLNDAELPVTIEIASPEQPLPIYRATDGMAAPVILTGVNYALLGEVMAMLERCDDLYLEASRLCTPGVVELLCRTVGASRLLFGSGAPEWHPRPTLAMIQEADISPVAIDAIMGGNAQRFYDLDDADDEEATP